MPELPDVEATRRYLAAQGVVGRTIIGTELLWTGAVSTPSPAEFRSDVAGRSIWDISRRGKYLLLRLGGRPIRTLVLHLCMTGSLRVQQTGRDRPRHTRNVLFLDGGRELCFVDPRKLGSMWLVEDEAEVLSELGPEPLSADFTPEVLGGRLSGRAAPVKALLCDQSILAGLGNIYADEVLFAARVHPLTPGRDLSRMQLKRIHEAIVTMLPEATERLVPLVSGGGPPTELEEGRELLLVPRSEGAPCGRCGRRLRRAVVRGRSAYFCSRCQAKRRRTASR